MTRQDAILFLVIRSLSNFLVLFSLYGVFVTFGPAFTEQLKVKIIEARGIHFTVSRMPNTKSLGFADVLAGNQEQILTPKDPLFSILIPKVGASAKVYPNVDPTDPSVFLPVLQEGVAHAKGSVFPGQPGTTYLFAHSADNWWDAGRYNAVFYTLNNLFEKDEIVIFFENHRYTYEVTGKIISDPQDITLITSGHVGPQKLVLQTCWPPGTTLKRLYILAKPKST